MTISSTPSVWAMRSLRSILSMGDAACSRRSAALRAEPSAKSQAKPAAAIAIDAPSNRYRAAGETGHGQNGGAAASSPSTWLWLAAAILAPFAAAYISGAGQ
jgi:hypothetical protein